MSYFDDASLVLIPSGYKDQKIFSVKPLSGDGDLTFSRASSATRVASNGLIEKVRTNVLLQSNSFDTTWITALATVTSGQTGYDGTNNAWLLSKSDVNGRVNQNITLSSSSYTFSVYAKAGTDNWLFLRTEGAAGIHTAYFDLVNGAVGDTSLSTASITAVGNGYYRCSISFTDSLTIVRIYVADANNDTSGTSGNILIQAAQLETGDIATDYIATTTAAVSVGPVSGLPRLDYLNSSCPRLLLEPQRTNLTAQSEDFNGWGNKVNVTTTANYAVSPDGYTNADRLQFTGNGFLYGFTGFNQTSGTVYTLSCYAKRNGSGTQSIGFFVDGSGGVNSAWTLTSNWQRFTYTYTAGNISTVGIAGASGADVSVYGFQFESGAYATSYIPTLSTSVTRLADAASKTGISSLYGAIEGVVYIETGACFNNSDTSATKNFIRVEKDANNWFGIGSGGASAAPTIRFVTNISGVVTTEGEPAGLSNSKIAFLYTASSIKVYQNGALVLTVNKSIGNYAAVYFMVNSSDDMTMPLKQFLIFPTALTDAECITLTT
jgi:hypothetical protein